VRSSKRKQEVPPLSSTIGKYKIHKMDGKWHVCMQTTPLIHTPLSAHHVWWRALLWVLTEIKEAERTRG